MKNAPYLPLAAVLVAAIACAAPPAYPPAGAPLAAAESLYADLRALRDRIDLSPFSAFVLAHRFGLERPTRQVVEAFLGRPVSPAALLADMRRMTRDRSLGVGR